MMDLKNALIAYYEGQIAKHEYNISVYAKQPVGIGEHPDIFEAVDSEVAKLAEAHDKLGVVRGWRN